MVGILVLYKLKGKIVRVLQSWGDTSFSRLVLSSVWNPWLTLYPKSEAWQITTQGRLAILTGAVAPPEHNTITCSLCKATDDQVPIKITQTTSKVGGQELVLKNQKNSTYNSDTQLWLRTLHY